MTELEEVSTEEVVKAAEAHLASHMLETKILRLQNRAMFILAIWTLINSLTIVWLILR